MSAYGQPEQPAEEHTPEAEAANEPTTLIRRPEEFDQILGVGSTAEVHNFGGEPMDQWRQVSLAKNGQHADAQAAMGKPLVLKHFYAHPIQINGPTPGEVIDAIRVVLFDISDNSYAFVSTGVATGLAEMVKAIGFGPWENPPTIKITERKTRLGRRFYTIVPA